MPFGTWFAFILKTNQVVFVMQTMVHSFYNRLGIESLKLYKGSGFPQAYRGSEMS